MNVSNVTEDERFETYVDERRPALSFLRLGGFGGYFLIFIYIGRILDGDVKVYEGGDS